MWINKIPTLLFVLFIVLNNLEIKSQVLYYQDIFNGGVTAGGFSTGMGAGSGQFDIYIEPGSTIRKAFLFTYKIGNPNKTNIEVNNFDYEFSTNDQLICFDHANQYAIPICLNIKDITNDISSSNLTFPVTISNDSNLPLNWGYWSVFLVVLYENPLLPSINFTLNINDINMYGSEMYNFTGFNPIDINFPVGFSLYSDRTGSPNLYQYDVNLNSNPMGQINAPDAINSIWNAGGVKGHFYYQNNQLFGLDDDIPNNSMNGSDGISDISPYISQNDNSFDFELVHSEWPNVSPVRVGISLAFLTTYVSPCSTFNTTITPNQTLCKGDTTQLEATGGIEYEWTPSAGLSCDDCPNPMASPETSTTYTCRIWSTDSCSKVLPVRVNVSNPEPDTVVVTPATCGSENGKIQVGNVPLSSVSEPPYTYSINDNSQSDTLFANLVGGNYELTVTDANGCTWSDSITVEEEIKTIAFSLVDPKEGHTPFVVTANAGSSQNATDYLWLTDNTEIPGEDFEYEYLAADEYDLCLLAWNNEPLCADTTCYQIIVHPEYFVRIPNVFTPNDDGDNDIFSIKIQEVQSIKWQIYNRWGNVLSHGQQDFPTGDFQTLDLWHGDTPQFKPAPDGVYYYKIDVESFGGVVEQLVGDVSLGR